MFYWIMTLQAQQVNGMTSFATRSGTTDIVHPKERAESIAEEIANSTGFKQYVVMFYHVEPVPAATA